MGAHPTPRDSQDIPIDPNRRPADESRQQADKKRVSQADDHDEPDLPRMPKQYPEPTD